ncbi:hypothetical protein GTA08_BOTSDO02491 [Neofusicoccum parvum]|uniref:Uncharacterized protein n=1 Tax=Neofusicoccum parvum TaxID=310453 RepID=A0ACB5SNU1_9PEZI|nr:hypothetical protein GTA08_BOTSDO02491 [Neofusicoccum parvum]
MASLLRITLEKARRQSDIQLTPTDISLGDMNSKLWKPSDYDAPTPSPSIVNMPSSNRNGVYEPAVHISPNPPLTELTNGVTNGSANNNSTSPFANPSKSTTKVIERLTASNDALRRDLNSEKAKSQELTENLRAKNNVIERLQSDNNTLRSASEAAERSRKNRKEFEETLRTQLKGEEDRRKQAEAQATGLGIQLGQATSNAKQELAAAKREHTEEVARVRQEHTREVSNLRDELQQAQEQLRRMTEKNKEIETRWNASDSIFKAELKKRDKRIDAIAEGREADRRRVAQQDNTIAAHDVVVNQLRDELEKKEHLATELQALFAAYKKTVESETKRYKDETDGDMVKMRKDGAEMSKKVADSLKHLDIVLPQAEDAIAFLRYVKQYHLPSK